MNKILTIGAFCLISVTSYASLQPEKGVNDSSYTWYLKSGQDSLAWVDGFSAVNSTVEFDLLPQNSSAQVGVLLRYVNENDWIYVGCDKATDHLGFAFWYVETPDGKTEIARDIAKLYARHLRRIKVNCIGRTLTVYVDGEQIAHKYIPNLPLSSGRTGFRVHDKGNVQISNVVCREVKEPKKEIAKKKSSYILSSSRMEVLLNKDFPSVQSYLWKENQSRLDGQPFDVKAIVINGDHYLPQVTSKTEADRVLYTLKVKEIGITIKVCCQVTDNVFQLSVTGIEERDDFKVKTLAFPDHNLVSVPETVPGSCLSIADNVHKDRFYPLKEKSVDNTCQYGSILLLNSDKLVATLESNSMYTTRQFLYQSVQTPGPVVTGIWGNEWIYRGHDGEAVDLPYIKVILSDDCNQDNKVDWQDGAIALQRVYPAPFGVDRIQNSYATITMNFASCAQYPFLRQLDNIKKFYLATDGFGQMLELKGYQSEGHDSAHPDYSGNYNERAGGKDDLAFLAKEARKYNAHIGVHINHSESYPEARAFNDRIVTDMPAWSWLDQSYFLNKEADMLAGTFEERLNRLKTDVPDLSFVYLDTYREYRWLAHRIAGLFNRNGWAVWTEDADVFDKEAVWIHYNPEAKSLIHRFVHHQYRDGYAVHPALLGGYNRGAEIGFMGWQKGRDFKGVIRNFFTKQLPYRYLMHYPVLQLDTARAVLQGGLLAVGDGKNGTLIKREGQILMTGDCVFIPWNPETEEKIYHYNVRGGKTAWQLPASWKQQETVYLYELSDLGRKLAGTLPVRNGQIEIDALPDKGYVVYKQEIAPLPKMIWSEGSPVKDTGFDSQSFDYWKKQGATDALAVRETAYGQDYLEIKGMDAAGVSQVVNGLIPDKEYVASVWVNVIGRKEAVLAIQSGKTLSERTSISESRVMNFTDNTDRFRTTWQRLKIPFRMPAGEKEIVLSLNGGIASEDTAAVCFDDVRLVECPQAQKTGYAYFEDFEHVDEGWGPFIACQPSAFTTHLSQKHDVYTDNTIHGNWSLATWRERNGEVYRTSPSMIRFAPGQEYEVEFDYKVDTKDVYKVVGKSLSTGKEVFSYELNRPGKCNVRFMTPDCTDFYIAVVKEGNGLLVIDDFGIKGELIK
ncbi:endo-alpha-N-acetylgalactosaminidase family protein [Parabacteroides faecis]|uniref:endo-alpha-N-acetylgalactosaminidase family protein n=1 Tax=Parabacteroides faecis TaxID=1217282 RepID=UPI0035220546